MADLVASWSPDPSTKCGAVIVDDDDNTVLAVGYNGFPRGVDSDPAVVPERWERPVKYEWVEHAERNAIYNAARTGTSVKDATMYLNYSVRCCSDCIRSIIQAGIRRVVGPYRPFPGQGKGKHYDVYDIATELRDMVDVEHVDMPEDHRWLS
jgi:dCMP deaminase